LEEIYNNILAFSTKEVAKGVNTALDEEIPAAEILGKGLIAAMEEVGRRFEAGEFFVPEMLAAAQVMRAGVEILRPKLVEAAVEAIGKVVIGTVKGDLHDIGKNLVVMMLEGVGFEIYDQFHFPGKRALRQPDAHHQRDGFESHCLVYEQ
jgi:5-methyltetrahydrofolate--homocysteine methyltransferase